MTTITIHGKKVGVRELDLRLTVLRIGQNWAEFAIENEEPKTVFETENPPLFTALKQVYEGLEFLKKCKA